MLFSITVMKSLKSFPVSSPCSDLLSTVNKKILKYSGKSTYPFHPGPQWSTWFCVLVMEIINNQWRQAYCNKRRLLIKLPFSKCFSFDIMVSVYNDFYGFSPLLFSVSMIAWEIEVLGIAPSQTWHVPAQVPCMSRHQQWGRRTEAFCILEEFDFKWGLASRKGRMLKAWWRDGWRVYMCSALNSSEWIYHGLIMSISIGSCLLAPCHVRNLAPLKISLFLCHCIWEGWSHL